MGESPIESRTIEIEDGSLLVLYTDGLVEDRHRDIDDGLNFLREVFDGEAAERPLDDLCRAALAGVYAHQQRDDIAILIARLSKIPADHHASWSVPPELTSAAKARHLIREPLARWGLDELMPTTELLVSELVTNAIRYATGEVTIRLVLDGPWSARCWTTPRRCPGCATRAGTRSAAAAWKWSASWPSAGAPGAPGTARSSGASRRSRPSRTTRAAPT